MDDTRRRITPLREHSQPVVVGTGLVALDVVIPDGVDVAPQLRAGGTCGNVLTALSFLGWNSYPMARLGADGASETVAADLRRWSVKLDFVTFDDDGSTPVVVQRVRNSKTGDPVHSFSRKCPACGAYLPWYKPVRGADVSGVAAKLPAAQVYFFDRTSRGALDLAKLAGDQGAVVFFEPSTASEPKHLEEALRLAHVVKLSSDRIGGNEAVLTCGRPRIVIETKGNDGLRFKFSKSDGQPHSAWHALPPVRTKSVRDTAGAGDWCAAGLIHMLGGQGVEGLQELTQTEVRRALQVGQAMASWACGFDGPRGGMYASDRSAFHKSVLSLLSGKTGARKLAKPAAPSSPKPSLFTCAACEGGAENRRSLSDCSDRPKS